MTRQNLNRIFYIYSEASAAVFFTGAAVVEILAAFALPAGLHYFAAGAALILASIAAAQVKYICTQEKNAAN